MRLISKTPKLGQAGDTIIEVIVVLAVLGFAISTSYATATRSLSSTRQAQENGHATQLLQSQLETIRSYATLPAGSTNDIFIRTIPFCVSPTNGDLLDKTATNCIFDTIYDITVNYTPLDSSFAAVATWDDVRGKGTDTVTLVYRLHPPL